MSCARLPGGRVAGGCPRRASGPSVPLSADTASPPPASVAGGTSPARGEKRGRELAPRPLACRGLCGRSPLRELPRAASGLRVSPPLGCRGAGDGLAPPGGGPRWWRGWGRALRSAVVRRPALGGGVCRRPAGAALRPPPSPCGAFPAVCPRPVPASRPPRGSRPVGTGGSRPRPSPRARPRPGDACPGGDPRDAAASARRCALSPRAAAVPRFAPRSSRREGGGGGGSVVRGGGGRGRAVRPSPVRASAPVRAPTRPLPNPGRLSAGLRPVRPVTAGSCSPSRPASVSPSLSAARGRRRPRPRRRRLLLPEGATGGRRWSVGVLCWCAGKGGRPGAVGRGSLCPLLGTLLAGAPAARARARPPRRDLRSDVATR